MATVLQTTTEAIIQVDDTVVDIEGEEPGMNFMADFFNQVAAQIVPFGIPPWLGLGETGTDP